MKHFKHGREFAKEIGISVDELKSTFEKYNAGEKNGKDEFGKKYFQNMPFDINDEFHVAVVTPVVHCKSTHLLWSCLISPSLLQF